MEAQREQARTDEDILIEVMKMGFDKDALIESLRNRVQNQGTVAYYLLLDNRFRNINNYLSAKFQRQVDRLKDWHHLKIPFEEIEVATENFKMRIRRGGYGQVYKGVLSANGKSTKGFCEEVKRAV